MLRIFAFRVPWNGSNADIVLVWQLQLFPAYRLAQYWTRLWHSISSEPIEMNICAERLCICCIILDAAGSIGIHSTYINLPRSKGKEIQRRDKRSPIHLNCLEQWRWHSMGLWGKWSTNERITAWEAFCHEQRNHMRTFASAKVCASRCNAMDVTFLHNTLASTKGKQSINVDNFTMIIRLHHPFHHVRHRGLVESGLLLPAHTGWPIDRIDFNWTEWSSLEYSKTAVGAGGTNKHGEQEEHWYVYFEHVRSCMSECAYIVFINAFVCSRFRYPYFLAETLPWPWIPIPCIICICVILGS